MCIGTFLKLHSNYTVDKQISMLRYLFDNNVFLPVKLMELYNHNIIHILSDIIGKALIKQLSEEEVVKVVYRELNKLHKLSNEEAYYLARIIGHIIYKLITLDSFKNYVTEKMYKERKNISDYIRNYMSCEFLILLYLLSIYCLGGIAVPHVKVLSNRKEICDDVDILAIVPINDYVDYRISLYSIEITSSNLGLCLEERERNNGINLYTFKLVTKSEKLLNMINLTSNLDVNILQPILLMNLTNVGPCNNLCDDIRLKCIVDTSLNNNSNKGQQVLPLICVTEVPEGSSLVIANLWYFLSPLLLMTLFKVAQKDVINSIFNYEQIFIPSDVNKSSKNDNN